MRRAAVIGAGPGGLAAAIALTRVGSAPIVFERSREIGSVGSALTLWPNALSALDVLGVADRVRRAAYRFDTIDMRSRSGRVLFRSRLPDGGEGLALRRADLVEALRRDLDAPIELGQDFQELSQHPGGVNVRFRGGSTACDVLIGADGARSRVRAALDLDRPRIPAGYQVWRGVAQHPLDPPIGSLSMGRGAQFGCFPLRGGETYWFYSSATANPGAPPPGGGRAFLEAALADWHDPLLELLAATPETELLCTTVYDCDPLEHWVRGRVALLGDAAHPAAPTLGQGACQALEDAAALARVLQRESDVPSALRLYEAARRERAHRMTHEARRAGEMGKIESRLLCGLRDLMIRWTPAALHRRQLRQMFTPGL